MNAVSLTTTPYQVGTILVLTKSTTVQVYTNVDSTQVLVLYLCTPALLETYTYKYLSRIESRERSVREGEVGLERTFQVGRARVGSEGGG